MNKFQYYQNQNQNKNQYQHKLSVFQGTFEEILNHIKKVYYDIPLDKNDLPNFNNYKYYESENSSKYSYITYTQKHLTGDYEFYEGLQYYPISIKNGFFIRNQIWHYDPEVKVE